MNNILSNSKYWYTQVLGYLCVPSTCVYLYTQVLVCYQYTYWCEKQWYLCILS